MPEAWNCTLSLTLRDGSESRHAKAYKLTKGIVLPFVPYLTLALTDGADGAVLLTDIVGVVWNRAELQFYLALRDMLVLYTEIDNKKDEYVKLGWMVEE